MHTDDGVVVQKSEQVMVIAMWAYKPAAEWDGVLNRVAQTYRSAAGATALDVIASIRPEGYVFNSLFQTPLSLTQS